MYELKDLMKDKVKGRYYAENLVVAPNPTEDFFFEVEAVLNKKKIKGIEFVLVKFLFYPKKVKLILSSIFIKFMQCDKKRMKHLIISVFFFSHNVILSNMNLI